MQATAARSTQVGNEEMPDPVRWIRSHVVEDTTGQLGTACIYQAIDPDALREHAQRADLPADEILPVVDTVIVRTDPAAN